MMARVLYLFSTVLLISHCGIALLRPIETDTSLVTSYVIGQSDFTSNAQTERAVIGLGTIARAGSKLLVSDSYGARVLIWNQVPNSPSDIPDIVLGQPSLQATYYDYDSGTNARSFRGEIGGVATDGTHVVVADAASNRVLIWNTFPTYNMQPADVVLGQAGFTTSASGLSQTAMNFPRHVQIAGTKLIVSDYNNYRVLIWNTIPTVNNTAADVVIGQTNFTSNATGCTASRFNGTPERISYDSIGGKLFITDAYRVMAWNAVPTANNTAADFVVGQTNLTTCTTGTTASQITYAYGVSADHGKLLVADSWNHRLLIWNTIPSANGAAADVVLGQSNFVTAGGTGATPTNQNMILPVDVNYDGTKVIATDWVFGPSMMIWDSLPSANNTAFDHIWGQADSSYRMFQSPLAETNRFTAIDFEMAGDRLLVPDYYSGRVLSWSTLPKKQELPDFTLLGGYKSYYYQTYVASGTTGTSDRVSGVSSNLTSLAVADYQWNRVMLWNQIPTQAGVSADVILGQPNTTGISANNGGIGAGTLSSPDGVLMTSQKLLVADSGNNRVLIWNTIPTVTGTAANVVIGQPTFVANSANQGGAVAANTLKSPSSLLYVNGILLVADSGNNRILGWNGIPTSNNQAADFVLGQANFAGGSANQGSSVSASTLSTPYRLSSSGTDLMVADQGNHRILYYRTLPTSSAVAADGVLGQDSLTASVKPPRAAKGAYWSPYKATKVGSSLVVLDGFRRISVTPWPF